MYWHQNLNAPTRRILSLDMLGCLIVGWVHGIQEFIVLYLFVHPMSTTSIAQVEYHQKLDISHMPKNQEQSREHQKG